MRTMLVTLLAACTGLACAPALSAQSFSVEVRGGLNRPQGDFRDSGGIQARGDAGFGADVIFSVSPMLSVYGGYGWDRFGCDGCDDGSWITSRAFEAGGKLLFGGSDRSSPVLPWVRAGVVIADAHVDLGSLDATSNYGVGLQGSAGVDIPLGQVLSFSPAVRYQRFPAEFDVLDNALAAKETVSFFSLDFGVHIHPTRHTP